MRSEDKNPKMMKEHAGPERTAKDFRAARLGSRTPSKGCVLVMDDDDYVGSILRVMLKQIGYKARIAWTGDAALKEFEAARTRKMPFDAVIIDLNIPTGIQGDQAMARMRGMDPALKAILLTGDITHAAVKNYAEIGFKTVLLKPFTREELQQAIQTAMGGEQ